MTNELIQVAEDSTRSGFFLIFGNALSMAILAISSIIIARYLGPELYGQYTLAFVAPQLIFLFADLGIDQGVIRFTSSLRVKGDTIHQAKIIQHGLLFRAAIGIAVFALTYAFADFFASVIISRPGMVFFVRIASIAVLFQTLSTTAINAFVGLDKSQYTALILNIQATAKTIIQIILVLLGFSVVGALMGHLVGYALAAGVAVAMLLFMVTRKKDTSNSHSLAGDVKTLINYGTPLYISGLFIGFVPIYQSLMLGIFTTDADIGNFRAAANFATLIAVITGPITTTLLPAFSKLDSSGSSRIKIFFKSANKYTAIIVLPVMMLVIIFSSEIVQIIYGSTFQSASLFLATYCLLFLLVGLGFFTLTSFFNGLGQTRTTLMVNLIIFMTFTIFAPLLTPMYKVIGLIGAILIANAAGTTYASYTAIRKFKIEFGSRSLAKIYIVAVTSSIPILVMLQFRIMPIIPSLIGGALLYLFFYATLIPFTRVIEKGELETVTQTLQKVKPLNYIAKPLLRYEKKIIDYREPANERLTSPKS